MNVVDRFLEVAERQAAKTAVLHKEVSITFGELSRLVRQYAACFSKLDAARVLIACEQGPHAYAAMLGTMLVGGFYAPVNTTAPGEKLELIGKQFQPTVLVGNDDLLAKLAMACPYASQLSPQEVEKGPVFTGRGARNAIAYIIFTSGSTGQPKGVVISHAALSHYINWVTNSKLFEPTDVVSQYTNIAFDVSILDIFGALCAGATLVSLTSRSERLMPAQAIRKFGITVWISVPSVISLMMRAGQLTSANVASVRRYFFAGEPLLETHVQHLFAACPDTEIWNAYGPTETTVTMTALKLNANNYKSLLRASVALGDPIPGMEIHLVGGQSEDTGEIVIVGPQVADGYWNAPALTEKSFRTVELGGARKRGYFSGDLGRIVAGSLFFESRLDHQVKIDGFRIELSEIAAAIRSLGWPEVVVLKVNDRLAAVIETNNSPTAFNAITIHARLREKLDWYAVPAYYLAIDKLPRSDNDKTDIKAVTTWACRALGTE